VTILPIFIFHKFVRDFTIFVTKIICKIGGITIVWMCPGDTQQLFFSF
jgi:hypothetical protein